ncbi:MAG: collagen-like protein, partial [Gammaproteobacteria bacterium]|nr:collagen-like protein [Gammaproteobacteria bacterium]
GPQGVAGADGATGPMGPQGVAGADGATGPMGPQGEMGLQGIQGEPGPMGPPGLEGAVNLFDPTIQMLMTMVLTNQETMCKLWLASPPRGQVMPSACESLKPNGVTISVEGTAGEILVATNCVAGEYSCQAKAVCETVTNNVCVHQEYECATGNKGSWYPLDGASGSSKFNFAYAYDFYNSDYGNICATDKSQMTRYGLAATHQNAGWGHWTRQ